MAVCGHDTFAGWQQLRVFTPKQSESNGRRTRFRLAVTDTQLGQGTYVMPVGFPSRSGLGGERVQLQSRLLCSGAVGICLFGSGIRRARDFTARGGEYTS